MVHAQERNKEMKRVLIPIVISALAFCVGCSSIKFVPQGECMQAEVNGHVVYVQPLVKVEF